MHFIHYLRFSTFFSSKAKLNKNVSVFWSKKQPHSNQRKSKEKRSFCAKALSTVNFGMPHTTHEKTFRKRRKKLIFLPHLFSLKKHIRNYYIDCATERIVKTRSKVKKTTKIKCSKAEKILIFFMSFLKSKSGRVSDLGVINHIRKKSFVNCRKCDMSAINPIKCGQPKTTKSRPFMQGGPYSSRDNRLSAF